MLLLLLAVLQGFDVWQALGGWVTEAKPKLGPGVSDRFKMAAGITQQECTAATAKQRRWGLPVTSHSIRLLQVLLCKWYTWRVPTVWHHSVGVRNGNSKAAVASSCYTGCCWTWGGWC